MRRKLRKINFEHDRFIPDGSLPSRISRLLMRLNNSRRCIRRWRCRILSVRNLQRCFRLSGRFISTIFMCGYYAAALLILHLFVGLSPCLPAYISVYQLSLHLSVSIPPCFSLISQLSSISAHVCSCGRQFHCDPSTFQQLLNIFFWLTDKITCM